RRFHRRAPPIPCMASLKRREELTVPNWPLESMTTGMALLLPVATPRIPAAKNELCVIGSPIRMTLLSEEAPWFPISMLLLPAVTAEPATTPIAMLLFPAPLFGSAWKPMAVLLLPLPLNAIASSPTAVLPDPVVAESIDLLPKAAL